MRTSIFLGCIVIADAIDKTPKSETTVSFLAAILIIMIVIDVLEFLHKINK